MAPMSSLAGMESQDQRYMAQAPANQVGLLLFGLRRGVSEHGL